MSFQQQRRKCFLVEWCISLRSSKGMCKRQFVSRKWSDLATRKRLLLGNSFCRRHMPDAAFRDELSSGSKYCTFFRRIWFGWNAIAIVRIEMILSQSHYVTINGDRHHRRLSRKLEQTSASRFFNKETKGKACDTSYEPFTRVETFLRHLARRDRDTWRLLKHRQVKRTI